MIFHARRRGSIYMAVLAAAMVTTTLGAGAIALARLQVRTTSAARDAADARQYAAAALDLGRFLIARDPDWRTNHSSGVWIASQAIGNGSFSLSVTDPDDNDLANSATDAVVLSVVGVKGAARSRLELRLAPTIEPLTCLYVAACADGAVNFTNSSSALTLRSDQTIATNAGASASGANIYARVETVSGAAGSTFRGDTTVVSTPRTVPTAAAVFDWYVANGTSISKSSLQSSSKIEKQLISSGVNPYGSGTTNARGIYVIQCGGADIDIREARIVGTLVLLNCGTCTLTKSVNWSPAQSNLPILLVQGNLALNCDLDTLDESPANYNPSHTPYGGASNSTTTDTYPSILNGSIYVSGNIVLGGKQSVNGCVMAGGALRSTGGTIEINYSGIANNPPPGFIVSPPLMRAVDNGLSQRVTP